MDRAGADAGTVAGAAVRYEGEVLADGGMSGKRRPLTCFKGQIAQLPPLASLFTIFGFREDSRHPVPGAHL